MEKKKQSRRITVKITILIIIAALGMLLMVFLLSRMQTRLYMDSYTSDIEEEFSDLPGSLAWMNFEISRNTETFDETYKSLAASIAFMANNDTGFRPTNAKMREYKELLDVDNVMIVSRDGDIVAKAANTNADFRSSRFNLLRTVFYTDEPSDVVDIDLADMDWDMRYYAAKIDDNLMVVIEQNPESLDALIERDGSLRSILYTLDIGQSGYIFAVSAQDYVVEYHPDESLIGADSLDLGLDAADLENGKFSWMTFNGQSYYGGVCRIGNEYFIAVVPVTELTNTRNLTVAVILFAFFAVMAVIIMYGIFVMRDDESTGITEEEIGKIGPFNYNKVIFRKAAVLAFVGLVAILVVSFYMQTLFALSSRSVTNNEHLADVVEEFQSANSRVDELSDEYSRRYLPVCRVAGYILDANPDLLNRNDLQALADILKVQNILVFDSDSNLLATNSSYTRFTLSDDPDDQSYEFIKILQGGTESVVQDAMADDATGELWQYIGVPLHDENGLVTGLVQVAIQPTLLEALLETGEVDYVLSGVKVGSEGFAFAINKEDNTFAYYPANEWYEGQPVSEYGISDDKVKDKYNDYLTIDGKQYYCTSAETEDYYIYLASDEGELMEERIPLTLVTGAVAAVCLLVIFLLLIYEPKNILRPEPQEDRDGSRTFEKQIPGGRTIRTESAASRWLNQSLKWGEKTAWQKTVTILEGLMAVLVFAICILVIFKDRFFESTSIFAYILGTDWERGLNVFAITYCLMFICVAVTIVALVQQFLQILSSVLSARGETICRLVRSFIKYAAIIGVTFYALYLIGIDGTTLLASAGILSIAISLGATQLVTDIISGLFIIFEGEFRVGDIIKIGDWRGTVIEIGIRTTKVEEPGQNVKIFRNSELNDVINMTRKLSYVAVDYGIEYSESLEHVEAILAKELPLVPERLPAIVDGPYYRGVSSWGDSAVNIRISMQCAEKDRPQLERDFNREMKLIFDRNDINVPFPQVVVHEANEGSEATEYEKWRAERFNQQQKEALKDFGDSGKPN